MSDVTYMERRSFPLAVRQDTSTDHNADRDPLGIHSDLHNLHGVSDRRLNSGANMYLLRCSLISGNGVDQ